MTRPRLAIAFAGILALQPRATSQGPAVLVDGLRLELIAEHPSLVTPVAVDVGNGGVTVIESNTHFAPDGYDRAPHDRVLHFTGTEPTVFHQGTEKTMSLKWGSDGWLYLATRARVLRVRDTDDDGRADREEELAHLQTAADYPHNGLCGLAFDGFGRLYFGMGENFGERYDLRARDGSAVSGGAEGGNVFRMTADGEQLERIATGFWNPFGLCFTRDGRLFLTDNDPDAAPPNRLIEVREGGDYGYQYRYGRSGVHPLQAWNGELPGTLGMFAGVGEAACELVEIDHDAWPRGLQGRLLVASWGDHRLETISVAPGGERAAMIPVVQGGSDFRPVGLTLAANGTLYVSDWVKRSYTLHGHGRLWRLQPTRATPNSKPSTVAAKPLASAFAEIPAGPLRALAQRRWQSFTDPARDESPPPGEADESGARREVLDAALADPDPDVRLLAVRWAAETKSHGALAAIDAAIRRPHTSVQMFRAGLAAIEWIENGEARLPPARLRAHLAAGQPEALRAVAARALPIDDATFAAGHVRELFVAAGIPLQLELLRAVRWRADRDTAWLRSIEADDAQPTAVRAEAALARGAYPAPAPDLSAEELGRRLFVSAVKVNCVLCHAVDGRGGHAGPDLTRLGSAMTDERLRESLDAPSNEIAPRYQTLVYTLRDGSIVTGIKWSLQDRTSERYDRLIQGDGTVHLVALEDIVERRVSKTSLMPPGLLAVLSDLEQRALLAYLRSLRK